MNLWKSNKKDIVRRCRVCGCRSDQVAFIVMKDSKSGKRYVHNLCRPCRIEANYVSRLKRLTVDPKYDSVRASAWNKANRERINKRRRENLAKKRGLAVSNGWSKYIKK